MITKTASWTRVALLTLIPSFGLFLMASAAPRSLQSNGLASEISDSTNKVLPNNTLYIVDGNESAASKLNSIDPNDIESISVLKEQSATDLYGEKGKHGVILVSTKKAKEQNIQSVSDQKGSLIIIDGKVSNDKNLQSISPDKIEKIEILKDKAATDLYQDKGKDGVIIVTLKK